MRNLLEFLAKYNHWILFVALETVCAVLLFRYNTYQGSVWFSTANAVAGKVYEINSAVESYFSLSRVNEGLAQRNFYLERQLDQLRRLYAGATGDTAAAGRAADGALSRFRLIPAKVVDNTLDRPYNLMTIDRGTADGIRPDKAERLGAYLWYAHVKDVFARLFPDLFKKAADGERGATYVDMRQVTDAQLRLLTDGDVTKEDAVRQVDCKRALTELNAKAAEARRTKEKLKS